jgi:hypothetical protein
MQVLELSFALPVLVGLLVAAMAYQRMLIVESGLTQAAIAGAREAGKGAGLDDVVHVVNEVLGAYGLEICERSGSVVVEQGHRPAAQYGKLAPPATVTPAAHEVRVTVSLALGQAKAGVVDTLVAAFRGKRMCASSLVSQEGPRG